MRKSKISRCKQLFSHVSVSLFAIFLVSQTAFANTGVKDTNKDANSKKDAPAELKSRWSAVKASNPFNKRTSCLVRSDQLKVHDGVSHIKLRVLFDAQHMYVVTDGNIDNTYKNTGVSIDNSTKIDFDHVRFQTNVVFTSFTGKHLQQVTSGKSMSITLGFWPSWPKTRTRSVNISLHGFPEAWNAFRKCK